MSSVLAVLLHDTLVGYLSRSGDGRVSFRFVEQYISRENRPTLGQHFEDDVQRLYVGRGRELPPFFANLVPERGPLRELLEASLQVPPDDEMALLAAVGGDLPGAVRVVPAEGAEPPVLGDADAAPHDEDYPADEQLNGLRFSLAGVQMKFSVMRDPERIALPAHNQHGEWIVKLDSARFPHVVENEFAVMQWARASGFDVPECYLQPITSVDPAVSRYAPPGDHVYVIRRYDRVGGHRIHQEDFAQVVGLRPQLKYDQLRYETCGALVLTLMGEEGFIEFVRRLIFVLASGNGDAHLKNWSLLYPDGIEPTLSPLYDQVSTIAWSDVKPELALKLGNTKNWFHVDHDSFDRLALKSGSTPGLTRRVVEETLERIVTGWRDSCARDVMPESHQTAVRQFWERVPLLKPLSGSLKV